MARLPLVWDSKAMMYVRRKKPRWWFGPLPDKPRKRKVAGTAKDKRKCGERVKKAEAKRQVLAGLLAAGAPKEEALAMAGYSRKSKEVLRHPSVVEGVNEIRERLQGTDGFKLSDSAEFYREMSGKTDEKAETRIKARTRLDSLLGYDASKKIEVAGDVEIKQAVSLLASLPVSPSELMRIVDAEVVEVGDVSEEKTVPLVGHVMAGRAS